VGAPLSFQLVLAVGSIRASPYLAQVDPPTVSERVRWGQLLALPWRDVGFRRLLVGLLLPSGWILAGVTGVAGFAAAASPDRCSCGAGVDAEPCRSVARQDYNVGVNATADGHGRMALRKAALVGGSTALPDPMPPGFAGYAHGMRTARRVVPPWR